MCDLVPANLLCIIFQHMVPGYFCSNHASFHSLSKQTRLWPSRKGSLPPTPPTPPENSPRTQWLGDLQDRPYWCLLPGIQIPLYSSSTVYRVGLCDQQNAGERWCMSLPRLGYETPPLPSWRCALCLSLGLAAPGGRQLPWEQPRAEASCPEPWTRSSKHILQPSQAFGWLSP